MGPIFSFIPTYLWLVWSSKLLILLSFNPSPPVSRQEWGAKKENTLEVEMETRSPKAQAG